MHWTIKDTEFAEEHLDKDKTEWWRVFNSMCVSICNWLYDRKIGNYSNRMTLEQCTSAAVLTEEDAEAFIHEFPKIFGFFEDYGDELVEMMETILRNLVGMKVWAN